MMRLSCLSLSFQNQFKAGKMDIFSYCIAALEAEESVLISAGTLAEVLIVAARRNIA